jgi:hypothetical protein
MEGWAGPGPDSGYRANYDLARMRRREAEIAATVREVERLRAGT